MTGGHPEDCDFDGGSMAAIESSNQTKQVVKTLTGWTPTDAIVDSIPFPAPAEMKA